MGNTITGSNIRAQPGERRRAHLAQDWLIRTVTPRLLDAADLRDAADSIRALRPITDEETLAAVVTELALAASAASEAWRSARMTARRAVWLGIQHAAEASDEAVNRIWSAVWNAACADGVGRCAEWEKAWYTTRAIASDAMAIMAWDAVYSGRLGANSDAVFRAALAVIDRVITEIDASAVQTL